MDHKDTAWIQYREQAAKAYDESNYVSPLQSSVMHSSHKLVEKIYDDQVYFSRVLEIGTGTGEHLPFVRHRFDDYTLTDLDSRALEIAEKKLNNSSYSNLNFEVQAANHLTYADNTFDRVIAVHVLEHIYKPHRVLQEWFRVLRSGGVLSILIPTDPGMLWRLGRHFGPRNKAIKKGLAYDYLMAREHVNSCNNLIAILRHYFPKSKELWWPLPIASIDLNLFYAFHATINKPTVKIS